MEEEQLVRALQKGEHRALDKIVKLYTSYLSAVVWRALGSTACREDVEEVVSDAFFALWQHRSDLDPVRGVKAYLAAVATNKAVDRLRTAKVPILPLEESAGTTGPELEEEVERREFAAALLTAVEGLPQPDRALVEGFYYENRRVKDLAKQLGLTVAAAKTRLCRARKLLKEQLEKGGTAYGSDG